MLQTNRIYPVEEIPYPPSPWKLRGQMWMGLFKTDIPIQLPAGLQHVGDPNSLIVVLVRYLEGSVLCYDELAFGTLTRLGSRIGIYVDYIWVTDLASVWGGRRIWGLPKNLAEFHWDGSTVSVSDQQGPIASLQVDTSPASLPWLWAPTPGIGQLQDNNWVFTLGSLWGRFAGAGMHIQTWSERFGYHPANEPTFGFAAKPFRMRVPAGRVVTKKG